MLNTSRCVTRHSHFLLLDPSVQFFIFVLLQLFAFLVFFLHSRHSLSDWQVVNTFSHSKPVFSLNNSFLCCLETFRLHEIPLTIVGLLSWALGILIREFLPVPMSCSVCFRFRFYKLMMHLKSSYQQEQTKPQTLRWKKIIEIRIKQGKQTNTSMKSLILEKIDKIENH